MNKNKIRKAIVASCMGSVGVYIIGIVSGLFLFGFESIDPVIEKYTLFIVPGIAIVLLPIMYRYLGD